MSKTARRWLLTACIGLLLIAGKVLWSFTVRHVVTSTSPDGALTASCVFTRPEDWSYKIQWLFKVGKRDENDYRLTVRDNRSGRVLLNQEWRINEDHWEDYVAICWHPDSLRFVALYEYNDCSAGKSSNLDLYAIDNANLKWNQTHDATGWWKKAISAQLAKSDTPTKGQIEDWLRVYKIQNSDFP